MAELMDIDAREAHLTLLTDLLSPSELSASVIALIAKHVAILPDDSLLHLFGVLAASHSLWILRDPLSHSSDDAQVGGEPWLHLDLTRARDVYFAVQHGIQTRLDRLSFTDGTGWKARRKADSSLSACFRAIATLPASSTSGDLKSRSHSCIHPFVPLVLASSILRAVFLSSSDPTSVVNAQPKLLVQAQRETVREWYELAKNFSKMPAFRPDDENCALPGWLIAQVLPDMPASLLKSLATEAFLGLCFDDIRRVFWRGAVFQNLDRDLESTPEGLSWPENSQSFQRLSSLTCGTGFVAIGRISAALGKTLEMVPLSRISELLLPRLEELYNMAHEVSQGWAECRWSCIDDIDGLHPDAKKHEEPWLVLKNLLFTVTMIYSSLISLVNAQPLSSGETPAQSSQDIASYALRTYSRLYFVTCKYGSDGFAAYRSVWYGSLDLMSRANLKAIQQCIADIEPTFSKPNWPEQQMDHPVYRSRITYHLNAVEQLVAVLPAEYIDFSVMAICKPYLEDKRYIDTFEAAHSVILAIFAHRRASYRNLSMWYSSFLCRAYPDLFALSQLRLAYSTMTAALAEDDDATLWYSIELLLETISSINVSSSPATLVPSTPETALALSRTAQGEQGVETQSIAPLRSTDSLLNTPPQDAQEAALTDASQSAALRLPRGALLHVLIDQVTSVPSNLLIPLLDRVAWFICEECDSPPECQAALIDALFEVLSKGMDMTKRETAAKWWLDNSPCLRVKVPKLKAKI